LLAVPFELRAFLVSSPRCSWKSITPSSSAFSCCCFLSALFQCQNAAVCSWWFVLLCRHVALQSLFSVMIKNMLAFHGIFARRSPYHSVSPFRHTVCGYDLPFVGSLMLCNNDDHQLIDPAHAAVVRSQQNAGIYGRLDDLRVGMGTQDEPCWFWQSEDWGSTGSRRLFVDNMR